VAGRAAGWLDLSPTGWVARVFAFNLVTEVALVGFWHWMTYAETAGKDEAAGKLAQFKFNKVVPYGPKTVAEGKHHLRREVFLQTLGWLQAAALQVAFARLYATGAIGALGASHFFAGIGGAWPTSAALLAATLARPETQWNVASVLFVTYWREIHFYFCHRMIHPWTSGPISQAPWWDLGALLYTHAHSWHHKSTNPGPWSGMSMHPVEHFFYFQCAWLPLVAAAVPALAVHPMHFLYALFHACIAPIAGHDGYAAPGGNSDYHYLHHAYLEGNYGVPFPFDFDRFFGSWVEPAWCDKTRTKEGKISLRRAKLYGKHIEALAAKGKTGLKAEEEALALVNADDE